MSRLPTLPPHPTDPIGRLVPIRRLRKRGPAQGPSPPRVPTCTSMGGSTPRYTVYTLWRYARPCPANLSLSPGGKIVIGICILARFDLAAPWPRGGGSSSPYVWGVWCGVWCMARVVVCCVLCVVCCVLCGVSVVHHAAEAERHLRLVGSLCLTSSSRSI